MAAFLQQLLVLLAAAAVLAGRCGGPPSPPAAHHIRGVPLAEVREDWCGPAALAAVLQFHGEKVAAADIAADIMLPGYHGSLNLDLLLWARKHGMDVWAENATEAKLKRAVAGDRPVICLVRRRGRIADRNHFVIVRGYDDNRRTWLVDDGGGEERARPMDAFDSDWAALGRWMMVVEGRKPAPPPAGDHAGR